MNDSGILGISEIAGAHKIILVDTCAMPVHKDELWESQKYGKLSQSAIVEFREKEQDYMRIVESVAGRKTFIIEAQVHEIRSKAAAAKRKSAFASNNHESKYYTAMASLCESMCRKGVIEHTEFEKLMIGDVAGYFKPLKRGTSLSDADFGIIVSSVILAKYRGSVGVLTYDSEMLSAFSSLMSYIPAGYRKYFGKVPNTLSVYAAGEAGIFKKNSGYDPGRKIFRLKSPNRDGDGKWENKLLNIPAK